MMKKISITQFKSGIGYDKTQKRTLKALGFKRLHQTLIKEATPNILGMVNKVRHLVKVEEVGK